MTLSIFIFVLISTIILHVLFFTLFFPLMNSQSLFFFTLLSTFFCQVISLLLYFSSQCFYNVFSGTVLLCFPILWLQSLSTTHFCLILCTSLCYRCFIRWRYPSYIHIHHCYICPRVLFVFYILLCLNSHLSLWSFFFGHFLIFSRMGYR